MLTKLRKRISDFRYTYYAVKEARKFYPDEDIFVMAKGDLDKINAQTGYATATAKLYEQCMEHMLNGGSACAFCEDKGECKKAHSRTRGCKDWLMRWPTEEEMEAAPSGIDITETSGETATEDIPEGLDGLPERDTENSVCGSGESPVGEPGSDAERDSGNAEAHK